MKMDGEENEARDLWWLGGSERLIKNEKKKIIRVGIRVRVSL